MVLYRAHVADFSSYHDSRRVTNPLLRQRVVVRWVVETLTLAGLVLLTNNLCVSPYVLEESHAAFLRQLVQLG